MFAGTQCFLFTKSKEEEWNDWPGSNDSLKIINLKMLLVNHNVSYFATNVSTFTTRPPPKCWLPLISLNNGAKIQRRHRAKPLYTSGVHRGETPLLDFLFFLFQSTFISNVYSCFLLANNQNCSTRTH